MTPEEMAQLVQVAAQRCLEVERRQVVGLLTEAHALRRYSDASERQRRQLIGEL